MTQVSPREAAVAMGQAVASRATCPACGDTAPPCKGCDNPQGRGLWQHWLATMNQRMYGDGECPPGEPCKPLYAFDAY